MLATRVRSAVFIAIPVLVVLVLAGPWIAIGISLLALGAGWEAFRLLRSAGYRTLATLGTAAAMIIVIVASAPSLADLLPGALTGIGDRSLLVAALAILLIGVGAFTFTDPRDGLAAWAATVFGALYVALLSFVVQLGQLAPAIPSGALLEPIGAQRGWTILLLVGVWTYDSGAYLFGKRFGRAKFLTYLSPSKTYAGLIGGIASSTLVVAFMLWGLGRSPIEAVVLGPALALAAQAGDLAESMIKRAAGQKDSSTLIPGHGGLLDRIDSFLFAAPVAALYVLVIG